MEERRALYPEGHFIGLWMVIGTAIFLAVGIPLVVSTGNPVFFSFGPAIGVSIGTVIGSSIEAKYRKEGRIRPLNRKEKKMKNIGLGVGTGLLVIGVVTFLIILLS
ncbi:MAG: hypothetical protein ACMUIE_02085 [Thermoplasmatota archaeon]